MIVESRNIKFLKSFHTSQLGANQGIKILITIDYERKQSHTFLKRFEFVTAIKIY